MDRHGPRMWRALSRLAGALIFGVMTICAPSTAFAQDSKGTDFWLMFNTNLGGPQLSLFITGDTATTGTVSALGANIPFNVVPGTVTTVLLNSGVAASLADGVENKAIHVTANAEVTVYGLNRIQATTDAFLGLPTDILGTEYIVLGYSNTPVHTSAATEFGVVASQNDTTVTITPSETTGGRTAGVPYNIVLDQGQIYQLRNQSFGPTFDLSGTLVTADKPIAVFGGNQCTNIPSSMNVEACDHVIEQIPPTSTWGRSFATMPLATRTGGDTFRILASTNNTSVFVNGAFVANIDRGEIREQIISGPASITADNPVLVAQYSNSSTFDGVTSDPFMMLIPPFEQFLPSYTVTTPASGFSANFINVVAPAAAVGSIQLDGAIVPAASFTPIGSTGFSGAQLTVALGSHTLQGPLPFGAFMYGFASFDSYGYPGGLALGEVASVTNIALAPASATNPVNTQHCVVATVTDQNQAPLSGIRVDFAATGANAASGFNFTDASGQAQFCYVGTALGQDVISANVGTVVSNDAVKTWVAATQVTCDVDGDEDVDLTDLQLIRNASGQVPGANNPRDANRDGRINVADVRYCSLRLSPGTAQ